MTGPILEKALRVKRDSGVRVSSYPVISIFIVSLLRIVACQICFMDLALSTMRRRSIRYRGNLEIRGFLCNNELPVLGPNFEARSVAMVLKMRSRLAQMLDDIAISIP